MIFFRFYIWLHFSIVHTGSSYKCIWCFSVFRREENFRNHSVSCPNEFCGEKRSDFSNNFLYNEHIFRKRKHICTKSYPTTYLLKEHTRKSHQAAVSCSVCSKFFLILPISQNTWELFTKYIQFTSWHLFVHWPYR